MVSDPGTETSKSELKRTLWAAADELRGSMDASEYKLVVLPLIFLKYISDTFEDHHAKLTAETNQGADPEDQDEYRAIGAFWVPAEARWSFIQERAKQPDIGEIVDEAMAAIERDNVVLKGVLPRNFSRPALDKVTLGRLIDRFTNITLNGNGHEEKDVLGQVYEYFLGEFALQEGRRGGEFFTPASIVRLLVEMIEPTSGRVYDPCCGSGGMFVQSIKFIEAHATGNGNGGNARGRTSIYGQESNHTTLQLARMNLAIRGIDANIAVGDSFLNDGHPDLRADYILANPPFNVSDWRGDLLRDDQRWHFGTPPVGNANFAWVQHFYHHLAPTGVAGFVLANGSMSSNQSNEGEIRKNLIEEDVVDCMIALPGQLFTSTQIPACLWFLARDKRNHKFRDRRGQILFIDARVRGHMTDRTHRELTAQDVTRIAATYHAWRGEPEAGDYTDVPGFCKSASIEDIRNNDHVLTPGRYVGAEAAEEDAEPFDDKMQRLTTALRHQVGQARQLDEVIESNLKELGLDD